MCDILSDIMKDVKDPDDRRLGTELIQQVRPLWDQGAKGKERAWDHIGDVLGADDLDYFLHFDSFAFTEEMLDGLLEERGKSSPDFYELKDTSQKYSEAVQDMIDVIEDDKDDNIWFDDILLEDISPMSFGDVASLIAHILEKQHLLH